MLAATSALAALGTATPASATTSAEAASTGRSDSCPSWACGSATVTFQDADDLSPVNTSVRDTSCNGSRAFVRLRVYYTDGTNELTPARQDGPSCDSSYTSFNGLAWSASKRISGFRVNVGDGVNGSRDGNYVDNPFT
ncbi:MAG: hypothetical protein ACRCY8_13750 [Dermatophilaceae bacterium]